MDKHVFISYKHDDSEFAENVIHRVTQAGFTTWIDSDNLHPGEDWREGIDQAIQQAFALIVIMSPAAKTSEYITYEWAYAWGRGIKVIPVMYKQTDLHPRLKSLQHLDFTNRIRPWDALMNALRRAADTPSSISSLLAYPIPLVPQPPNEQKVQEWIDKGKLFLQRKDYQEALETFRQAILLDPGSAYAYSGKSEALYRLEKYKEALTASEQAIKLDAHLAYAWTNKGYASLHLRGDEETLAAFDESLRLDPKFTSAWNGKGIILNVFAQYEEALAAFDEALRLDPESDAPWNNKGKTLYNLRKYEEALAAFDEALRLDPAYGPTWENKSDALKELGRIEEAEQCHRRAIELGYTEEE